MFVARMGRTVQTCYKEFMSLSPSAPLVSILINNYNYGRYVRSAIESALSQTYQPVEVIVVDDGSTDNSREIIESCRPDITPVFKKNGGHGSTFNAGFVASSGDILCLLDADDVFVKHKVEKIVTALQSQPELEWCFNRVRIVDIETNQTLRMSKYAGTQVHDLRQKMRRGGLGFGAPPTSGLSFKRSLWQQFFPIPEASHTLISDRYLIYASFALAKGIFLDEPLTDLRIHGANDLTNQTGKQDLKAKKDLYTAKAMREHLPLLRSSANTLFARGLSIYRAKQVKDDMFEELIRTFWATSTPLEKLYIRSLGLLQTAKRSAGQQ